MYHKCSSIGCGSVWKYFERGSKYDDSEMIRFSEHIGLAALQRANFKRLFLKDWWRIMTAEEDAATRD